jgi:mannose-6-phosphate isomerase
MQPLHFEPYFRPLPWGGRRLAERLGKRLPEGGKYGECWELSGHPHHVSRVAEGPLQGTPLTELWRQSGAQLLGRPVADGAPFPLLIKFLDCDDLISVQVHPQGKTECWVVLEAAPTARIYAGLKAAITRADLERSLDTETVAECLHRFTPRPGDCVLLPAGTVHAAGGGVLLAEVQQPSDITFRLFDWNRRDREGKTRPLHRPQALESIDWNLGPIDPVTPVPFRPWRGVVSVSSFPPEWRPENGNRPQDAKASTSERLIRCRWFQIDRHHLRGTLLNPYPECLSIWMVIEGTADLQQPEGDYRRPFRRGETVLIPAAGSQISWNPGENSTPVLLAVTVPE